MFLPVGPQRWTPPARCERNEETKGRPLRIPSIDRKRALLAALTGLMAVAADAPLSAAPPQDPALFLPGRGSRELLLAGATFSPDERSVYFTRYSAFTVEAVKTILVSHRSGDEWSDPVPVSFSGRWSDTTPFVSPDGRRLYFASNRPVKGETKEDFDIWFVERSGDGWSEPRHVGAINGPANETSPALTASGVLYFCSWREEGSLGLGDLWRAEPLAGGFGSPRNLGPTINGPSGEWGVTVSPDEQLIVFESSGRSEGLSGAGDLYMSQRVNGTWAPAVHLKAPVNSASSDLSPRISPDGRELYFASTRGGHLQMWRVPLPVSPER